MSMSAIRSIYRLQLRLLATKGRILGLGAIGVLEILLALTVRGSDDPVGNAFSLISTAGLAGVVPVASLVLASAALGDPAEDATLVHLWLRPIPRWTIAVGSWLAVLTLAVPLAVVPTAITAAVCGVSVSFIITTLGAALLGTLAYSALFVGLGLRVQRALAWGLAYVLIWEGAIANAGAGLSRLAIRLYTRSLVRSSVADEVTMRYPVGRAAALTVPIIVTVVGLALATRRLTRTDIA